MKRFVAKYALTDGVVEKEVTVSGVLLKDKSSLIWYRDGLDAFERREDAVASAEKRRLRKVASLKKQLAKLEALRFE